MGDEINMPHPGTSTRAEIIQAAIALFSSRGCAATGMRDIARAVGINAASIYHHFRGKQALIDAVLREAEASMQAFMPRPDDGPLIWMPGRTEADYRAIRLVLMMQYEREDAADLARRMLIDAPRALISAALSTRIEAGSLPPIDCDMLAGMAAAHLCSALNQGLIRGECAGDIDRRCEEAVRSMLAGLTAKEP